MKKFFATVTFFVLVTLTSEAQKVKINGTMKYDQPVRMIYLNFAKDGERITDSSRLEEGKFTFEDQIAEPTLATLMVRFMPLAGEERPRAEAKQLFIEPGKITVSVQDSIKFAKIAGSKANKEFEVFTKLMQPYNEKQTDLNNQYRAFSKAKDKEGMQKISDDFDKLSEEKTEIVFHAYLNAHPSSSISLYVLGQYAGYDIDPEKVEPIFNKLSAATRKTPSGIAFKERIETAKKTGVGVMAMNFTQNDTLDNPVSLASFKGKYVLLDFWASWCGPCRAENPNVVKNFNEYKDKNFTVLSVSLDQPGKKQAWLDAIHKDGLTWTHVSDLKFWNNDVAKLYGIRAIPQNLLIDPTGKIIAKNIRGEELSKKLGELIKD